MNADEIVRALHKYAKNAQENFEVDTMRDFDSATDLIESLTAQLSKLEKRIAAEGFYDLETMISKYKTVMLAANEISIETDEELEELRAQLSASQRREKAAVEMLIKFIKQSDDACDYCKNLIECKGEGCECFEQGKGGTSDGKEYPDFKWTCEDFDHGTCRMMKNTPCNGCFENDCSGFEWRGQQAGKERRND